MNIIKQQDDTFSKLVEDCKNSKSAKIIHNASLDHAKILIDNLLQVAAEKDGSEVRLISDSLRKDFYKDLIKNVDACLNKSNKSNFEILVIDPDTDLTNNDFASEVKKFGGKIFKATTVVENSPNFLLVGENAFRFERDRENVKAVACFNNSEIGSALKGIFEEIKENPQYAFQPA